MRICAGFLFAGVGGPSPGSDDTARKRKTALISVAGKRSSGRTFNKSVRKLPFVFFEGANRLARIEAAGWAGRITR